jgi:deoxyribose-phosphate aldolase
VAPILPNDSNPYPWGRVNEEEIEVRCDVRGYSADVDFAISCIDYTSLEGSDTPNKIRTMCAKAIEFGVASVCVYPLLVSVTTNTLNGSNVKVCSVAGGFPSGLYPLETRLNEIRFAIDNGADEIDVVMNRSAFLSGDYDVVYTEIASMRDACGSVRMKVILETGELPDCDAIRNASYIAMEAGADFIKTSTGKIATGATLKSALCMMDAIADYHRMYGRKVGMKPSGGIRNVEDALRFIALARNALGPEWLSPELFRIGASSLLDELINARR